MRLPNQKSNKNIFSETGYKTSSNVQETTASPRGASYDQAATVISVLEKAVQSGALDDPPRGSIAAHSGTPQ